MFKRILHLNKLDLVTCPTYSIRKFQHTLVLQTPATATTASTSLCMLLLREQIFKSTPNKRLYTTKTIQPEENVGLLKKVLKKVIFTGGNKSRLKVTSCVLYESVADKVNYLDFFANFRLPNTFNSWFLVTELHVWMLLIRAMAEGSETGEDGRYLRNCIVEAMWADVNARAKKLGASNPSGTRAQIEVLSEQFQAALISYDEGIMSDDKSLASALWRRFFEMNCEDYVMLENLVVYVREQMKMLDNLSREEFIDKPQIRWLSIKELANL